MTDETNKKVEDEFDEVSVGETEGGERTIKKIVVDRAGCIGARSCALVAPGAFQMDEENLAYVPTDKTAYEDDETIRLAAESCPVLAIHLYDKQNKKVFPEE